MYILEFRFNSFYWAWDTTEPAA